MIDEKESSWQGASFSSPNAGAGQATATTVVMSPTVLTTQAEVDQLQPGQEYQVVQQQVLQQPTNTNPFAKLEEVSCFPTHTQNATDSFLKIQLLTR